MGPQALAHELALHKSLTSRLLSALRMSDSLAVIRHLPRSGGLSNFLRAAETSVAREYIGEAKSAVSEFHAIVKGELGGWDALAVAISSWLPETRERAELDHRRQLYSGFAGVFGASTDTHIQTFIVYPGSDGANCDIVEATAITGLRRRRPGREINIETIGPQPGVSEPSPGMMNLFDTQDLDSLPLLREFCSSPLPPIRVSKAGNLRHFYLAGDAFGVRSSVDLCVGEVWQNVKPLYQPESGLHTRCSTSMTFNIPVKTFAMNVLLEDSVWPGSEPELRLYRMVDRGIASPNDPTREIDRLDCTSSIESLGHGVDRFHSTEYPRHVELVQHVCDKLEWDSSRLRGYRLRVQYPIASAQYSIVFTPPQRSTTT